ncbi:hypothetical protein LCGC14_2689410 [marine sediment metagenome]|uniref:Uncharacterized protein n=1 Tax=marine sediment metagenome TaxID=412755 RepID=A0A0F9A6H2_9ZZZZ
MEPRVDVKCDGMICSAAERWSVRARSEMKPRCEVDWWRKPRNAMRGAVVKP